MQGTDLVPSLTLGCLDGLVSALPELRPIFRTHINTLRDVDILRLGCASLLKLKYSARSNILDPAILRTAVWYDYPDTVRFILEVARKRRKGGRGKLTHKWLLSSAMRIACVNGNVEVVKVLMSEGCEVEEDSLRDLLVSGDNRAFSFASEGPYRGSTAWRGALFRCVETGDDERALQLYSSNPSAFNDGAVAVAVVWFGNERKMLELTRIAKQAVLTEEEEDLVTGHPGFSTLSAQFQRGRMSTVCSTSAVVLFILREFGVAPTSSRYLDVLEDLRAERNYAGMDFLRTNWPDDDLVM